MRLPGLDGILPGCVLNVFDFLVNGVWLVAAWFLVFLMHSIGEAPLDLFPLRLYVIITLVGALQMALAGVAGGWVYREGAEGAAAGLG